jgi:hypothetical protein
MTVIFNKVSNVRISGHKPNKFHNHGFESNFFRGQDRKSLRHPVSNLSPKHTYRSCAGSVPFLYGIIQDVLEQCLVLFI